MGATLHRGARASHYRGLSRCGAQAPDAQAQQLWLTGLVAPRHVGSSQTRARTHVPRTGRQTLNHCATREAPYDILYEIILMDIPLRTKLFPGYRWAKRIDRFSQMRKVRDRERKFPLRSHSESATAMGLAPSGCLWTQSIFAKVTDLMFG